MSFYDEYSSGKIVSRVTSDTEDFATVVTLTLNLLSQVLLVVLIVGVLFCINCALALLTLTIAPVIVLHRARLPAHRPRTHAAGAARRARAVNAHRAGDDQRHHRRQELPPGSDDLRRVPQVNQQSYQVNLRQGFVFSGIFPLLNTVAGLGTVVVVYFGGLQRARRQRLGGDWFLFVQAIDLFWFPLTSIASFWSQFQQGLAASERVFALIDAEPRVRADRRASRSAALRGRDRVPRRRLPLHRRAAGAATTSA